MNTLKTNVFKKYQLSRTFYKQLYFNFLNFIKHEMLICVYFC